MAEILTPASLQGVWAFIPTPWDEGDRLDEDALTHDVEYLCTQNFAGIYTTSSSGEFFALTMDEFRRLTSTVLRVAKRAGVPVQIGCGATDTRAFLQQANHAVEQGADAVQVILPFYRKLKLEEAARFFEAVAGVCGDVPLVHYNTGHAKLMFEAEDYRRLKERVPSLIGTKLPNRDPLWFATVCETVPELSHFTGEYTFVADFVGGAQGIYSWLALTNPRLAIEWFRMCRSGAWNDAIRFQRQVNRYKIHVKSYWQGSSEAAINKADARMNPRIRCDLRVRDPYASCTDNDLESARSWARHHFPELLDLG